MRPEFKNGRINPRTPQVHGLRVSVVLGGKRVDSSETSDQGCFAVELRSSLIIG